MLESYIVIGLVIALVEIIKQFKPMKKKIGKLTVPILVVIIAGVLNVLNAFVFDSTNLLVAFKDGLTLGAIAGGIYSMGQTYLNKEQA